MLTKPAKLHIKEYCSKCAMPVRRTLPWDIAVLSRIHAAKFDSIQIKKLNPAILWSLF